MTDRVVDLGDLLAGRPGLRGREQHLAGRRRLRGGGDRRRPRPRPIVEAVADGAPWPIVATHGHNDHINAAAALAEALGRAGRLHPRRPHAVGRGLSRHRPRTAPCPTAMAIAVGWHRPDGAPHPGPLARAGAASTTGPAGGAVLRATRCSTGGPGPPAAVLRLPHHHRVDPHPPAGPAGRHPGAHRARGRHHHRRRSPPSDRMDPSSRRDHGAVFRLPDGSDRRPGPWRL